MQNLTAQTTP